MGKMSLAFNSQNISIRAWIVPFLYSVLLFCNTIYNSFSMVGDYLPYQNLFFTCFDFVMTLATVIIVLHTNKMSVAVIKEQISSLYVLAFNYFWPILLPLVYVIISHAEVTYCMVLDGATRDYIALEVPGSRFMGIMTPMFLFLAAFVVINRVSKPSLFLILLGFLGCLMYRVSRSPLHSLLQIALVFNVYRDFKLRNLIKLCGLAVSVLFIAAWISAHLQGRGVDNMYKGVILVTESVGRYSAASVGLAEYAIDISNSFEKVHFPFIGYFSEKFLAQFSEIPNSISFPDSRFIVDFKYIGNGEYANVLYPWWAWFYGSFGVAGFLLKFIFTYILFSIAFHYRMFFFSTFLLHMCLFTQIYRHPVLNADNAYLIISMVFLDVFFRFFYQLVRSFKNYNIFKIVLQKHSRF